MHLHSFLSLVFHSFSFEVSFVSVSLVALVAPATMTDYTIGKFKLTKSDNFDKFLEALGIGMLKRKVSHSQTIVIAFSLPSLIECVCAAPSDRYLIFTRIGDHQIRRHLQRENENSSPKLRVLICARSRV